MAQLAIRPAPQTAELPPRPVRLVRSGGNPPTIRRGQRSVSNGLLAMAIFLGTETMLFAGLISAYLILRAGVASWPPADQPRLPVEVTGLNTLVLLCSAYTMLRATGASRAREDAGLIRWLAATAALGATFLLVQGVEWVRLIRHGLGMSSSLYGATFYTLIGFHGVHVLAAVIALAVLLLGIQRSQSLAQRRSHVDVCQLYWLFVVAVWPILYVLVYLA